MRKTILILILMAAALTASAQPISGVRSSALMDDSSVLFNLDFIDPYGIPGIELSITARMGTQSEEYTFPLSRMDEPPYYDNTHEADWVFEEPGAAITFYARAQADTIILSQSYENSGNQFPPDGELYAPLIGDAVGDTMPGTIGSWLDLTGSAVTYSDNRLFGRLSNDNNQWPTNQGQYFFFYAFIMQPPDSIVTHVTAMVYGDIPFFFEPGLYSLNVIDTSFEYIAEIQHSEDQYLHMSCAIDDLLSAPGWDTWPPQQGFIVTAAATFTITFTTPNFNDFTFPSGFIPATQYLQTDNNSPPVIGGEIVPLPGEHIDAYLSYTDPDNNLPVERNLIFDDQSYEMGTYDRDYTDMALFEHRLEWPGDGWHTYYFRFSDGAAVSETELDSVYLTSIGVEDEPVPSTFRLAQNYPNPFNANTSISFGLPEASVVNISVYDISGGLVAVIEKSYLPAGSHSVVWNGENYSGQPVSTGVYFYRLSSDGYSASKRMVLLK